MPKPGFKTECKFYNIGRAHRVCQARNETWHVARHGYRISPGSLYPILHGLEKKGYLRAKEIRNGRSLRKVYRATPAGRKALAAAKSKVSELFRELMEGK